MGEYSLIQTREELEALARTLSGERVIGVDTEADSFFHYFEKVCLLQISCKSGIFLVDPLELPGNNLDPLAPVFRDPEVRKVFHAADYDLHVLHRHGGIEVCNIFDTMLSAQLLGYPAVGLGALVERHFDIKLSKDQQRTDWSRRPLRQAQIEYAASDVRYLIELTSRLEKELRAKGRLEWVHEEFLLLEKKVWPERSADKAGYLRIKGAKKLTPRELAVLRELHAVRDKRGRDLDRPVFKVLGNGTLLELAQNPPTSKRTLARRKGITDLVLRRLGQEILDGIQRGLEGPEHPPLETRPPNGGRRRLDRKGEARLKELKRLRARRARELDLDPGVLCPNALLEHIAWAAPDSAASLARLDVLRGWRLACMGEDVLETLQQQASSPAQDARPESREAGGRARESRRQGSRSRH